MKKVTVGILQTGLLPDDLINRFSSYPVMFQHLLNSDDDELNYQTYSVVEGKLPNAYDSCDVWLITGSKHAAYESHPWTEPLCQLIREAFEHDIPLVGICFGHQIICHALGGVVENSDKGWGLGATSYNLVNPPQWMDTKAQDTFTIQAIHQDQVISPPQDSQVIASTPFCPYAALNIADKALTFQGHPEFSGKFSDALLSSRRDLQVIPVEAANRALENITAPLDQDLVSSWIRAFIRFKLSN